ncbi:MAG: heparin lyase I family protein [Alphaproteobacteria bacterium]
MAGGDEKDPKMSKIIDYPLNADFSGVNTLQAQGVIDTGNNLRDGIEGALSIENGVMKSTITQSDTLTATAIRSEITAPADSFTERWYVWEFMLPEGFNPNIAPISLMQIHDTPDGGDGAKAVPFALYYEQAGYLAAHVPLQTLPAEGANFKPAGITDFERGRWHKACLHAFWSTTFTGFREFYMDGVPLFRHFNLPAMYSDVTGPYLKLGCYDATHNARFGSCTAYFRNVAIWFGNDGYFTVMGGIPALSPQRVED